MKQINLLPTEIRERAAKHQVVPVLVIAGLVSVASAGLVWVILRQEVAAAKQEIIVRHDEQQKQLVAETKRITALSVSGDLQNRIAQLNALAKSDVDWARAFSYVGQLTPKDIYLTNFTFGTANGALGVKLGGEAPSNLSFAQYMESLRTSTAVQNPKVEGFTYNPSKGGTVTFTVSWQVPTAQVGYTP